MVNQINPCPFTHFTVGLHCDTHNQAYTLMNATGAETLHIEKLLPEYHKLIEEENGLVRRATAYVSTTSLKDADKKRDNAAGVILNVTYAYTTSTISAKRTAANALDAMLAPYKGVARSAYRTETRELNGMIAVLQSDAATAHIATLGLTSDVEELVLANTQFDLIMQQKQMEESARSPQTTLSTDEVRVAVDAKYQEIVQVINAYAVIQSTPEIEQFIVNLNAILRLAELDATRGGKQNKDTEEGTTPETETPETETPEAETPEAEAPETETPTEA